MNNTARRKKVSYADFVKGYVSGCNAGLSADEIAEKLGMAEPSMTSRASGIRQEAAELGKAFPSPAGGGVSILQRKKAKVDLLTSLLGDLDNSEETGETDHSENDDLGENDADESYEEPTGFDESVE